MAACWRHVGYIMVLYLAGLKSFDPTLREAAQIDGANERQTFFRVVFPVMTPINVVVIVITVIESLRAFDIVYITNQGQNGLELLSALVTNNVIGEASRVGFGSAIAMVLFVDLAGADRHFLSRAMREDRDDHGIRRGVARHETSPASGARRRRAHRAAHVPDRRSALLWLVPLVWAIYTSLRPYADTQQRGYVSIGGALQPRQLPQCLDTGRPCRTTSRTPSSSRSRPSS